MKVADTGRSDEKASEKAEVASQGDLAGPAGDRPVSRPEDDLLGRAPFAKGLARSILTMGGTDGLTIALYGEWGSGKTSTLELVAHYLHEQAGDTQPLVVRFNPWWFSEPEAILVSFFLQMQTDLKGEGMKKLRTAISKYGAVIGGTVGLIPGCTGIADIASSLAKIASEYDIHELRRQVDETLRAEGRRIVVMIDDIDRLTSSEIRQVFQLVRAVADFPNTVYLLAFDAAVVAGALSELQAGSGYGYIDKIVQVPIHLPQPSKHTLRQLFVDSANQVLGDSRDSAVNEQRWARVLSEGIEPLLRTLRDVKRYVNGLRLTWPLVHGEVDTVDFLGLEALRVFLPEVYARVRDGSEFLCGAMTEGPLQRLKPEELTAWHEELLERVPDEDRRRAAHVVLEELFPKFHASFGGSTYGPGWGDNWRRARRICSEKRFEIYFQLSIPEDFIPDAEMESAIASLDQPGELAQMLRAMANVRVAARRASRARLLLERLHDYIDDQVPADQIGALLDQLYEVADVLVSLNDGDGFLPLQNGTLLYWLTDAALRRLPSSARRMRIVESLVEASPSVSSVVLYVRWCDHVAGDEAQRVTPVISQDELTTARTLALKRLHAAQADGSLRRLPQLAFLLSAWREWEGDRSVLAEVSDWTGSEEGIADFITRALGYSIDGVADGGRVEPGTLIGVSWSTYFPDLSSTRQLVQEMLSQRPDWMTDYHVSALTTFMHETRQSGETAEPSGMDGADGPSE